MTKWQLSLYLNLLLSNMHPKTNGPSFKSALGFILKSFLLGLFGVIAVSCVSNSEQAGAHHFIYLAHTRMNHNDSIYKKVYDIDFSKFEMTLLGGDLALNSFKNDVIVRHLDSVFDFKNPNTLWSIGNHDDIPNKKFFKTTFKNKFHAYQKDDVTFITLNSQDSLSSIVGEQRDFLFTVLDTLQTTSVVVMTHKLIFMNDHPIMDAQINKVVNGKKGTCFHCHNTNNFNDSVYPKLKELSDQGVQIIWVGGDLGYETSHFEYMDEYGVVFLGNGFWYPKAWNKILLFSKKAEMPLKYTFVPIDSLLKYQDKSFNKFDFK